MSQPMPETDFGFLLTDVSRLFRQSFEKAVERSGFDLTSGEARTLAYVMKHPGSRQSALANFMSVEPMTLSAYIDRLEAQILVTREICCLDRRAKSIMPTTKADFIFGEFQRVSQAIYSTATFGLADYHVNIMHSNLSRIRNNLCSNL